MCFLSSQKITQCLPVRSAITRPACSFAQALAADFQQSSRPDDCAESSRSPVRVGSRQPALGFRHDLRTHGPRLTVSGRCARSLLARSCRLGDASPYAAGPGACRAGDGRGTPAATSGGAAALGSWQPILAMITRPCFGGIASCHSFAAGKLLGQCRNGGLFRWLKAERVY